MTISGAARIAGVFGWPVAHSRSPRLHNFWLDQYGIDGAYIPFSTPPEAFEAALRALPALGFRGTNVTVPHKEAALKLVDRADDLARRIGAVNTIVVEEDGSLSGTNTDAFGFSESLSTRASGWSAAAGPAVVLGAGGASRAVLVALIDGGAPEIRLANRTRARADEVAADLGGPVRAIDWEDAAAALDDAALLVNTTTLGMTGQPPLDLDLDRLPKDAVVNDIVYVPLKTDLLARAEAHGNRTVDGLEMLLHQARPGFERWFGTAPEVTDALRQHVLDDLEA